MRLDVEEGLAEVIRNEYPEAEVLMGTATAGIAHAAITAHMMGLPMGYVRSGSKDHGRQNQIEGKLEPGQKVVVVEDLISTAGSSITTVDALREAGAEVLGIVSIFTYGMKKGLDRIATWIPWQRLRQRRATSKPTTWNASSNSEIIHPMKAG